MPNLNYLSVSVTVWLTASLSVGLAVFIRQCMCVCLRCHDVLYLQLTKTQLHINFSFYATFCICANVIMEENPTSTGLFIFKVRLECQIVLRLRCQKYDAKCHIHVWPQRNH